MKTKRHNLWLLLAAAAVLTAGCQPAKEAAPPVRLSREAVATVEKTLGELEAPVTLDLYLGGEGQREAPETQALLDLMTEVAPSLTVVRHDLDSDPEADRLREIFAVQHGPFVRINGPVKGTFVFYGYPERRELQPFLDGVLTAAGRSMALPAKVEDYLSGLDKEVVIRIFTTPD